MSRALAWAFPNTTVGTRVPRLANTCAVVAVSVDALSTELCGAVWAGPTGFAVADTVDTLATKVAVGRTMAVGAFFSKEARKTIASTVVAIPVARTVGGAGQKGAVVTLESVVALAKVVDTNTMPMAIIRTGTD